MVENRDRSTQVEAVRRFNRFYTRKIGVLEEGFLKSPFSLTETRVLYELAQRDPTTATALSEELGLNPGYLSRILRRFQEHSRGEVLDALPPLLGSCRAGIHVLHRATGIEGKIGKFAKMTLTTIQRMIDSRR